MNTGCLRNFLMVYTEALIEGLSNRLTGGITAGLQLIFHWQQPPESGANLSEYAGIGLTAPGFSAHIVVPEYSRFITVSHR